MQTVCLVYGHHLLPVRLFNWTECGPGRGLLRSGRIYPSVERLPSADMEHTSLPLPPPPSSQALSIASFSPGPLDGSLMLPELLDWNYEHSPNHPLFAYASDDGSLQNIFWSEAYPAILGTSHYVRSLVSPDDAEGMARHDPSKVIGIFSQSGAYNFFFLLMLEA